MRNRKFRGNRLLTALSASLLAVACGAAPSGQAPETDELVDSLHADPSWPELANGRGAWSEVVTTNAQGQARRYAYQVVDGQAIAEGDMVLGTVEELENADKGVVRTDRLWPKRTLVYRLHSSLTDTLKTRISDAMAHWTSKTGVLFRARSGDEADYVEFKKVDEGCNSKIGRVGGKQTLNLSSDCSKGNVIHEIGHSLGFEHEHTRADREDTIRYYEDRVLDGAEGNFTVSNQSYHDDLFTIDFGSIMMYGSYAFAKNDDGDACGAGDDGCEPTLTRRNGDTWISQRSKLSDTDIKTFRTLYDTFTDPRVNNLPIAASLPNANQFCKEQGYASAPARTAGSQHGTSANYLQNQWTTLTTFVTTYTRIRCAL